MTNTSSQPEEKQSPLQTEDFDVACFLVAKGIKLKAIRRHPSSTREKRRGIFIFEDSPESRRLLVLHETNKLKEEPSDPELSVNVILYERSKMKVKTTLNFNLGKYNQHYAKSSLL